MQTHLPKPYLVMPFDICEVLSADGKPLRGSVMNELFMMEFINSRSKSCEFPLRQFHSYNCFVRWVLILSRISSRIDPISDARCTGRQHSKKHSQNTVYYLTKSGICMPTFHIAQIYIHRNSSRYSEVRPILKNLVMPLPDLR